MKISLIGMSGAGKTYWAQKFESIGFRRYSCNDIIEEKLGSELKKLGYSGIRDVAKWMGQPYEKQYAKTSKRFLELERETMMELFNTLKNTSDENIVIDTTGSVIYTGEDVLKKLKEKTLVVMLDTPNEVKEEMYKLYLTDPKPVIWGESYFKFRGETNKEALARCYEQLLEYRLRKYRRSAHIIMSYYELHSKHFILEQFKEELISFKAQSSFDYPTL